jgi:prevent-host-death family protein
MEVNLNQANAPLSTFVARLAKDGEIIITDQGRPVARLAPYENSKSKRTPGLDEGSVTINDNFDEPLPEEFQQAFGL